MTEDKQLAQKPGHSVVAPIILLRMNSEQPYYSGSEHAVKYYSIPATRA